MAVGFGEITVSKALCTRLPPNPCVKGMGSAPAESDFLHKKNPKLGGVWKETLPLHSAHYGQKRGVGSLVLDVKHTVRLLWLV